MVLGNKSKNCHLISDHFILTAEPTILDIIGSRVPHKSSETSSSLLVATDRSETSNIFK